MKLNAGSIHGNDLDDILDVANFVSEKGYPNLIAGSHFLAIGPHRSNREYGQLRMNNMLPFIEITSLMGDNTRLLFLEYGINIGDEAHEYVRMISSPENSSIELHESVKNLRLPVLSSYETLTYVAEALDMFEDLAAYFFHVADAQNREFNVQLRSKPLPPIFIGYNLRQAQVLIEVAVKQ